LEIFLAGKRLSTPGFEDFDCWSFSDFFGLAPGAVSIEPCLRSFDLPGVIHLDFPAAVPTIVNNKTFVYLTLDSSKLQADYVRFPFDRWY